MCVEYEKVMLEVKMVQCNVCRKSIKVTPRAYKLNVARNGKFICRKCAFSTPTRKQQNSNAAQKLWKEKKEELKKKMRDRCATTEFKAKMSALAKQAWERPDYQRMQSEKARKQWQDEGFVQKQKNVRNTATFKRKMSRILRRRLRDGDCYAKRAAASRMMWRTSRSKLLKIFHEPNYRAKMSKISQNNWGKANYRAKMTKAIAAQPKVSKLAETFYSILDDLGIKYYREYNEKPDDPQCQIGPGYYDCVIPREGKPDLVIEIQGWRHYVDEHRMRLDRSKAAYIANNLAHRYELKYIWDHELACRDKIVALVKYWMGITKLELIEFSFKDIGIRRCPAKDYRPLLSKYHYLPNAGRGGVAFGAYLGNELIAVCAFSPLVRQNITIKQYSKDEVRELSRLCIHPRYQKKNFASWLISKTIKQLDEKYKCIIAYSDTTFNHIGTIYKAANFVFDRSVRPDYWYVSSDGWVMHKKTLYDYAVKNSMTEKAYAEKFGYIRVYGKQKLRFIYERSGNMDH